ncbi:FAD-binding monooxygenase [Aurantimonas sp. VKM B-3413]|uniref:FAD-binding monooxygenase n=1 Tax=Aurantimonas sp. VKM B-3413 TaxID=2779401 RepID=UPI001E3C1E87|nr:FAD-binding monooxygenase [Aurantimonas sp. VKM B-3413]MCB8837482.1 FAD-binding monooxygenase [Aurantimonas sp. VKM B-3413]
MQFHLNGYRTGDPAVAEPAAELGGGDALPETVDVLIVGCGPAGLALAAQLSAFPEIRTAIVEQKSGPLLRGQADGIACRTMEMFEAYGFAEKVLKEACWVNETSFWKPDETRPGSIVRSGRIQDTEDGLSEFPHVILNQARVHDFFLEVMRNAPTRLVPHYDRRLVDLTIDTEAPAGAAAVDVRLERADAGHEGEIETLKARYVVGCDGARSAVRGSLGRELHGDSANAAWGVMDVLAVTDFPDIRMKALIQSEQEGSIVLIPREGGYLVRLYVELDKLNAGERVRNRNITVEDLIAAVQRIFSPYSFSAKEVAWWSVYEIGQRLTDKFDDVPEDATETRLPRVFIAGDACHTHSPKAGQGMNVSMQDAFNLGWKLAAVIRGLAEPALLHSYSAERQAVAKELIDFDREWAEILSGTKKGSEIRKPDPKVTQDYFVRHGRYTAGTATRLPASVLSAADGFQHLARGLPIGMRFHSAPVIRVADAKPMQLGHVAAADGRWRLYAFAGPDGAAPGSRLAALCAFLAGDPASPVRRHTPAGADIDAVIDLRAVFQQGHRDLAVDAMPQLLKPVKGRYGLVDYEKMFSPDLKAGQDIFDLRSIDREGCMVLVRPDQYVASILPLDAHGALADYFAGFMIARSKALAPAE